MRVRKKVRDLKFLAVCQVVSVIRWQRRRMNPSRTVMREVGKELEHVDILGRDSFNKEIILNSEKINSSGENQVG